jgi:hypothetical protein
MTGAQLMAETVVYPTLSARFHSELGGRLYELIFSEVVAAGGDHTDIMTAMFGFNTMTIGALTNDNRADCLKLADTLHRHMTKYFNDTLTRPTSGVRPGNA